MLNRKSDHPPSLPRNRRRERRLWHDQTRNTPALGCLACPEYGLCGGLKIGTVLFDCLRFCCGKPAGCTKVCRSNPDFPDRVREIGGFNLCNAPRGLILPAPKLPQYVPIVFHGNRRQDKLISSAVALPLCMTFNRGEGSLRFYEHSENPATGLLVYRMRQGMFEFVVSDFGVGVLNSLRKCSEFNHLSDYGDALRLALSEGVSRFGANAGRGMGFRQLFVGLANFNGVLRFRSGDHALVIDGENPTLMAAKTAEKPRIRGFLASIALRRPKARPRIQAHQPR